MPRKPKVQRTPEEKWQIVLEGLKSGNVAETCRKYEIAPTLYYRWKDEVDRGFCSLPRTRSSLQSQLNTWAPHTGHSSTSQLGT
jgi:transposase-like protein